MGETAAALIAPFLSPIVHTFTTLDLTEILSRSQIPSFSALLAPFESGVEKVSIRTSSYESRLLPRFSVRCVERSLPDGFGHTVDAGATPNPQRRRSSSLATPFSGGLPHMPSPAEPQGSPLPPLPTALTTSTNLPFLPPSQAQRDELFLDSLSTLINDNADAWIDPAVRPELRVRGAREKRRGADAELLTLEDEGWKGKSIEELTPWYATMRDQVLRRREMVEWETFAWPVGCLLALSTSHPDPLGALATLWDLTSKEKLFTAGSYPSRSGVEEDGRQEWANPEVLRYIVLIHDSGAGGGRDGWEDAQKLQDKIQKTYGSHTALLPLFSAAPTSAAPQPRAANVDALFADTSPLPTAPPAFGLGLGSLDPSNGASGVARAMERGGELSEDDLRSIRVFMREMVVQSVIPFMERSVVVGNEQYIASKRSIGGRLFSAGRKYFGGSASTSRSATPVSGTISPVGFNALKGYYPFTAQESQTRRLADLAFMIGDYKLAASIYDSASKDYKTDRAWKYYSSACRMAGLSQLLLHPPLTPLTFNPDIWLEMALQTPIETDAVDLDGLQATMLYYEAYRAIGDWRPASIGLVRTAGLMDEVSSALLLEQAALTNLHLPMSSRRKYAFHMAMAAARYERCGLKSFSRRCLSQAVSIYKIKSSSTGSPEQGWDGIRSHCYRGLARQAYNAGRADQAIEYFLELPLGSGLAASEEAEGGEESWLDDFALAWEHFGDSAERIVDERGIKLQTTIFDADHAVVRLNTPNEDRTPFAKLEAEFCSHSKIPSLPQSASGNVAVLGDIFYLELRAVNPLDASLAIGGLRIDTDSTVEGAIDIDAPQEIELGPRETIIISIPIRSNSLAPFAFTQLSYRFNDLLPIVEPLIGTPKRLTKTREHLTSPTYAPNTSLHITVRSPIPVLSISLDELPTELLEGETRVCEIEVRNIGGVELRDLRGICDSSAWVRFGNAAEGRSMDDSHSTGEGSFGISNRIPFNLPTALLRDELLAPGASMRIPIVMRGEMIGERDLKWLFVYSGKDSTELLTTRISLRLTTKPSLEIHPILRPSNSTRSPYLLQLEILNSAFPSSVQITQIASLSSRWRIKPLSSSPTDAISPLQSLNIFATLEPVDQEGELDDSTEFVVRKLNTLLQGKEIKTDFPKDIRVHESVLQLSSSTRSLSSPTTLPRILSSLAASRNRSLVAQLPTIAPSLHPHLFPLLPSSALSLILFYTTPTSAGHLLLTVPIGARTNVLKSVLELAELKAGGIYAESQRERRILLDGLRGSEWGGEDCPAVLGMSVEENLVHDFAAGPCRIPMKFILRNISPTLSITYTLSLSSSTSSPTFSGSLTYTGTILPLALAIIETTLWFPRAGSYDIGRQYSALITEVGGMSWTRGGERSIVRVKDVEGIL